MVALLNFFMVKLPSLMVMAALATRVVPPSHSARESRWPLLLLLRPLVARAGS